MFSSHHFDRAIPIRTSVNFARRIGASALIGLMLLMSVECGIARAEDGMTRIRDAETESLIRSYAAPIWKAAGLDPSAVRLFIISSNEINAFVAGGQNLFLFTGLILKMDTPNQLIGVIAHETGHMSGGHLARGQEQMRRMTVPMILTMLLGAAAMAGGGGEAGTAVMAGGAQIGERLMTSYTRTQEASADQAAVSFLQRSHQSGEGLLEVLEMLGAQELLATRGIDPYVLDHPLSQERVDSLQARVDASPYKDVKDPPALLAAHARMKAKLYAFLQDPMRTLRTYPVSDTSIPARYARAVAYHRAAREDAAMREMDALLAAMPDNPYFWELKGQILFEAGHVREAIAPYQKAVDLNPSSGLLRIGLAQAMIATEDPTLNQQAIDQLKIAMNSEREYPFAWQQLGMAYGQAGNEGMASLATGEKALLTGDIPMAKFQAKRAARLLPQSSPEWLRAKDLIAEADDMGKQRRGFRF